MSSNKGLRNERNSGAFERLTCAALFAASAAWVLWQNSRVAVLWDLGYLLDSAWRFSLAQRPYREIPFAHAPLTFLVQAGLIRVFGRVYWPHVAYAALASGLGTVLAWRLLCWVLLPVRGQRWGLAAALALPLVPLGIYGVYPHPIYDSDCILACLMALFLLTRVVEGEPNARDRLACVVAGAVCALPIFVKQNIGIPFFGIVFMAIVSVAIGRMRGGMNIRRELLIVAGGLCGLGLGVLVVEATVGCGNYVHWTVRFAGHRRLPGVAAIAAAYRQDLLVWGLPCTLLGVRLLRWAEGRRRWVGGLGVAMISAPLVWTAIRFLVEDSAEDRADGLLALWPLALLLAVCAAASQLRQAPTLRTLLPWILLVTIHAGFLAQQLWGSTYACWPLLMLLIAGFLVGIRRARWTVAAVVSSTFLVCGGMYAASLERLSYIHLDGAMQSSSLIALRGMRTRGPWLPGFDELVQFTGRTIPEGAAVLLIPGEDPFFFATGRVPRFPALLFDPATYPYSPEDTVRLARENGVDWLIVKRDTQLTAAPYDALPAITAALLPDFTLYRRLTLYDVYRRK